MYNSYFKEDSDKVNKLYDRIDRIEKKIQELENRYEKAKDKYYSTENKEYKKKLDLRMRKINDEIILLGKKARDISKKISELK